MDGSFFNQLSPKSALTVGLAGGIMALCTVGFVVILGLFMKGKLTFVRGSAPVVVAQNDNSGQLAAAEAPAPAAPRGDIPSVTNKDHIRGDANAPVTIIEYSDFECPFCKRHHPTMLQVMDAYKGKVKWVYRHFPLSFHQNAQKEAEASECAAELGGNNAFWSFTDKIFERTAAGGTGFPLPGLPGLAAEVGVNQKKFEDCLNSGKYAQYVIDQMNAGGAAGVDGTPGSFIIGRSGQPQLVKGAVPFDSLKAAIDAAL